MNPKIETDETRTFNLLRTPTTNDALLPFRKELPIAAEDPSGKQAAILVADDSEELREVIVAMLRSQGYSNISETEDGQATLDLLRLRSFDLLLLDIEMPRLDGFGVLEALKNDSLRSHLPIIVTSGLNDIKAVVRCIGLGAEDFLQKPVNSVLLRARVAASLERKYLRDLERMRLLELQAEKQLLKVEQEKSDRLLLNILPKDMAERLKKGQRTIAARYEIVTVLFADLVGFSTLARSYEADVLVSLLNDLFSDFDRLTDRHQVEKVKTIGDCYMVAGGLPEPRPDHAHAVAAMALEMLPVVADLNRELGTEFGIRIGINSGPVVAGVIGRKKFTYDLWGDTVNIASRMESSGVPNRVQVSAVTRDLLGEKFLFTERGMVECKGIGEIKAYLLDGKKE